MTAIAIPGIDNAIEEASKPAIPEGKYLAIVTNVSEKTNSETGSYGLNWDLLVNLSPNFSEDGWDEEARGLPMKHYTYIGKKVKGKVSDTSNAFATAQMLAALGQTSGNFDDADVRFRQIIVQIKHEPDNRNPDSGVLYPRVKRVFRYTVDGEVAPVLPGFEDYADTTPDAAPPDELNEIPF